MSLTFSIDVLPKLGNLLPILGNLCAVMSSVSFLLSDRQLRILQLVLLAPSKTFSLTDMARVAGPGHGATQRYVQQLIACEVLVIEPGRQRRYRANPFHPIYQELRLICDKVSLPNLVASSLRV